jgi:hypothetical protein
MIAPTADSDIRPDAKAMTTSTGSATLLATIFRCLNLRAAGRIISDAYQQDLMSASNRNPDDMPPEVVSGHPRGTLALVVLMGLAYAIGWLVMYFGLFVDRGLPHAH